MMNKKTIDKKTQTSETSSKTKDGSKKDIRPEKKGNNKLKSFLKSEMTHFITGLIILMFGAFLSLAFLSFFFTGDADQSSLENLPLSQLTDVKNEINNWTGYFGAYLADLFINRWVGISAFFFCIIFVSTGLKLMKIKSFNLVKIYIYSLVLVVWFSLFFGFFFISGYEDSYIYLGGLHGFYMSLLLKANVGWIGTFLIIILSFIIIMSFLYNPTIEYVRKAFNINLPKINIGKLFARKAKPETEQEEVLIAEHELLTTVANIETEESEVENSFDVMDENSLDELIDNIDNETIESSEYIVTSEPAYEDSDANDGWEKVNHKTTINDLYTQKFGFNNNEEQNQPVLINNNIDIPLKNEVDTTYRETEIPYEIKDIAPEKIEQIEVVEATEEETSHEAKFTIAEVEQDEIIEKEMSEYDPTLDLSNYKFPTFNLLNKYDGNDRIIDEAEQSANKRRIEETLNNYGIEIQSIVATVGPTITLYEIIPKQGIRISKIRNLEDDIALSLAALGIRIIAPIPGKGTVGIEVPNKDAQMVSMYSIIASRKFQECHYDLPVALGKTITNDIFMIDLAKMPHILVAGATGQGKSVGLNAILTSLLYKKHPAQLKLVLIDPKKVEFNIYSKIERHFLAKLPDEEEAIITDVTKVVATLNSICKEMDERYDLLKAASTRNIKEYNAKFQARKLNPEKGHRYMPYIVVVVDEFGDLIMTAGKEVELPIARIAQLARAVGIHMIIATQRPSTNIITGIIKANFPARIAFRVSSMIDSRTILDASGANQLIGRGDMLFSQGSDMVRVQCAFVDTPEVEQVSEFIGDQHGYPTAFLLPEYVVENGDSGSLDVDLKDRDVMFDDAARLVVANQQGSTSMIQRKFSIGYNRAGRIMDQLEAAGIVGPFEGSKARQVLVMDDMHLDQVLSTLK